MKVKVYQARLTIEEKQVKLTKAIAKQFPVHSWENRRGAVDSVKEPICKVSGKVLASSAMWLYLVKDEEAGLAWEPACTYHGDYGEGMRKRGYNVDEPAEVPTVIL